MLILQPEEIEYCHVSHLLTYPVKPINGLSYHGHLFVEIKSYAQEQFPNAVRHCRELLEIKASVLSIIVKEPTRFTLWSEDKYVQRLDQQNSPIVTQQSIPNEQTKGVIKYRGVEILPQVEKLPRAQKSVKSELKYRGRSCL